METKDEIIPKMTSTNQSPRPSIDRTSHNEHITLLNDPTDDGTTAKHTKAEYFDLKVTAKQTDNDNHDSCNADIETTSQTSSASTAHNCQSSFKRWRSSAEPRSSWILLFMVVMPINILAGIEIVSFSIYYVEYAKYFYTSSRFAIGIIVAIKTAMASFSGVLTSVLITRYGCRVVSLAAGTVMSISLGISSFAANIIFLQVFQGFFLGIGTSFCIMSINIITQQSFSRNRALAGGLEMLGITLGNITGTYLVNFLIDEYSWRGSVRIQAAIMANIIPLSLLMPRERPKQPEKPQEEHDTAESCPKKALRFLRDMFDFSLLKNIAFLLVCIGCMLQKFNGLTLLQHITSRAVYLGMTRMDGANMIFAATVAIIVSRSSVTFAANLKCSKRIMFFATGTFIGGISSFIIVKMKSFWGQVLGCAISGVHIGLTNTVFTVMLVDLMGIQYLSRSLALCHIAFGITSLISTPIGGLLYDITGDYDPPFILAGVTGLVGGLLIIVAAGLDMRSRKRQKKADIDRDSMDDNVV